MFFLHVCMCPKCVPGAYGDQKTSDNLDLELWLAASRLVDDTEPRPSAGQQVLSTAEPSPQCVFLFNL